MTTFPIPEGKVVDRIELEAGEGKATINIMYKEEKPKEKKHVVILCETNEPTTLYYHTKHKKLVEVYYQVEEKHRHLFVPMANEAAEGFVVLPKNDVMAKLTALDAALWQLSDSVPLKAMTQEQKQLNKQLYDCFTDLSELISYSGSK